ncbi:XRE family transcriptional regulator [Dielma fastidiosa]|uniref:Peptidase S24-like protein n=1 Tax=Dielma fastidiosa TaxID=1034346 RepID=A0A318KI33_9FIRM|nr:XRE family transcriptional regulator [Dielma fastidiosa]PXX75303.1 peptidase S24-like protein [Dielma fastidiosa]
MSIGKRIRELRESKGLTQSQLAELLGITKSAVGNYELDLSGPKESVLYKLIDVLECDANYLFQDGVSKKQNEFKVTPYEQEHIKKYRTLDRHGKKAIDQLLDVEYTRIVEQSLQLDEVPAPYLYTKTEYLTGLSAGTGLFVFDDIPTQVINVPEEYKEADFVIGVSGDSMQPTYYNGDKVAVKKSPCISRGEIGVFMIDGSGYIKELGDGVLISHNKSFNDINLTESTICIGRVLGKI